MIDEEDLEDYCKGGYHHTMSMLSFIVFLLLIYFALVGDTFADGRYTIVRKLGWGHFSLVSAFMIKL